MMDVWLAFLDILHRPVFLFKNTTAFCIQNMFQTQDMTMDNV
jgi:hypothetical protein